MATVTRTPLKDVLFRSWTRGDIPVIARMARDLYHHIESIDPVWRTSPMAEDLLRAHLTDLYANRYAITYLACTGLEIVGFITGTIVHRPPVLLPHRDGLVDNAYVRPEWRGKGIGSRLCRMLLDWFIRQEIREVRIHYQVSNRQASAFWEKMGFRPWTIEGHCFLTVPDRTPR